MSEKRQQEVIHFELNQEERHNKGCIATTLFVFIATTTFLFVRLAFGVNATARKFANSLDTARINEEQTASMQLLPNEESTIEIVIASIEKE